MLKEIKLFLKEITPPIIWKTYQRSKQKYGFFGNYSSWEDAVKDSDGYDSDIILNKVKDSLLQVKEGKAVYERDSVLFDKIEYSFPVLATLLKIALENGGKLSVLDFGGSLGSHYFQYQEFLSDIKELRWGIVEQPKFVNYGKDFFENEQLRFYLDIDTCLHHQQPEVILLSSVLPYLPKPYDFLKDLTERNLKFIIVDRTGFLKTSSDRLTVQKVTPEIYEASYPALFFSQEKFLKVFQPKYNLIIEFEALDKANIDADYKGFVFQLKT